MQSWTTYSIDAHPNGWRCASFEAMQVVSGEMLKPEARPAKRCRRTVLKSASAEEKIGGKSLRIQR